MQYMGNPNNGPMTKRLISLLDGITLGQVAGYFRNRLARSSPAVPPAVSPAVPGVALAEASCKLSIGETFERVFAETPDGTLAEPPTWTPPEAPAD